MDFCINFDFLQIAWKYHISRLLFLASPWILPQRCMRHVAHPIPGRAWLSSISWALWPLSSGPAGRQTWWSPMWLLIIWATWGKRLNLSDPQLPHLLQRSQLLLQHGFWEDSVSYSQACSSEPWASIFTKACDSLCFYSTWFRTQRWFRGMYMCSLVAEGLTFLLPRMLTEKQSPGQNTAAFPNKSLTMHPFWTPVPSKSPSTWPQGGKSPKTTPGSTLPHCDTWDNDIHSWTLCYLLCPMGMLVMSPKAPGTSVWRVLGTTIYTN